MVAFSVLACLAIAVTTVMRARERPTLVLEVQPLSNPDEIRVYVGGAVVAPGLYTVPRGSRVAEAIDAAGGVTALGDITSLGMAAPLEDADQIIVPTRAWAATPPASGGSSGAPTTVPATGTVTDPEATPPLQPIDINTATAAELEALPGIGPTIAARIVEYRIANGPFQSVDELEAVKGISAAMVDELRPLVTVGR